jgi:segregation and condensation protein B
MSDLSLTNQIECILFVADGPIPIRQLAALLDHSQKQIEVALEELQTHLASRGLRLQIFKERVQLVTMPEAAGLIETFLGLDSKQRLSQSAVESLAVIAYQQPITRPQIDAVRGVNSDGVLKRLLAMGLVEEVGRADGPGRPILYGTTAQFLQHFGLAQLNELPPLQPPNSKPAPLQND